ncbi:MAG: TetR/AcrR family transcriptional regulator [Actinomycetota bacterium]
MPRPWSETIDTHRRDVRDAILDSAARLAAEQGPLSVTMSQVASATGIGRATLYKYFPDVETILLAWHVRQVEAHVEQLAAIRDGAGDAAARLAAVLDAFAAISHENHATDLAALLHRGPHVDRAHDRLRELVADLVSEGAGKGQLRVDVAPSELASYCLHALSAARDMPSRAAVRRLVRVTLSALRPQAR